MLKLNQLRGKGNLQQRFIVRVLAPPFFILLILGILIFLQLNRFVHKQAIDELTRSTATTAAKLEREFAIREIVLKRTGEELFTIKNDFINERQKLESNRATCSTYLKQKKTFVGAPDAICEPFLAEFSTNGPTLNAIEEGYVKKSQDLIDDQNQRINDRLSAYKQFFPETLALMVVNDRQQLVSSALSEAINSSSDQLLKDAARAQTQPIEGTLSKVMDKPVATFAYPIQNGSVLAVYALNSDSFIKQTWESAPIDRSRALAVILDSNGEFAYPDVSIENNFKAINADLRSNSFNEVNLKNINHIAVGTEVGSSKWLVVIASPKTAVLSPVRDAQLAGIVIIGLLLIGFLWVGTFFIQRTVRNIIGLVSGALVFASGKLDYKIKLAHADKEFSSLADTMNMMAGRIAAAEKDSDEKNKEFISIATHELRTPLTAVLGNLSMVTEDYGDKLDPKVKPLVEEVYASTKRLRDLVNDMLDVARLEGGRTEFIIKPVPIKIVIDEIVKSLQVTAQSSGIKLDYREEGAQIVMADESRLRIILNNFISNAIKYNQPDGSVSVSHYINKDAKLVTAIADTGLGIPEDQKAHMFEKFFRVQDDDRKNVVGTGLGMYITRQYVLEMEGEARFESVHGKGTTFYFSLPIADEKPEPGPNDQLALEASKTDDDSEISVSSK